MSFTLNKSKNSGLPKIETTIAEGTNINGDLNVNTGSVRIDGKIDGENINAQGIIIGENGKIKSNINANVVIISGYLQGNVEAKERVEILATANVFGNVKTPCISIAEGSIFEGSCLMEKGKSESSQKKEFKTKDNKDNVEKNEFKSDFT
ncbi:polymer-forming cytoskeletal protein [bacterium]